MMRFIFIILYTITTLFMHVEAAHARLCIASGDFGTGGTTYVYARPQENDVALLKASPLDQQVAPWIDSGFTVGSSPDPQAGVKIVVEGSWFPLGIKGIWTDAAGMTDAEIEEAEKAQTADKSLSTDQLDEAVTDPAACAIDKSSSSSSTSSTGTSLEAKPNETAPAFTKLGMPECTFRKCLDSEASDIMCLSGGLKMYYVDSTAPKKCRESRGYGLYGLIALSKDGTPETNPNDLAYLNNLPTSLFRTFMLAPLEEQADHTKVFRLYNTNYTQRKSDGSIEILQDLNADGTAYIPRGKLYFKILDKSYDDNYGFYAVSVVEGATKADGIIAQTITFFEITIAGAQELMYKGLIKDTGFVALTKAIMLLYALLAGIMYMIGMARPSPADVVIKLFKFAIIATVISEGSWEFFNEHLFKFFTVGSRSISSLIIEATLYKDQDYQDVANVIPEGSIALSAYDLVFDMFKSKQLNLKIWSLLFTQRWYFIFVIYAVIIMLIVGILKSIMIYLLATINVALLIVTAPIFIILAMFELTKNFFEDWFQQMLSCAMMLIFLFAMLALMIKLVITNLQTLLYFRVCYDPMVQVEVLNQLIIDWWFWAPANNVQVDRALTLEHFLNLFMVALLFYGFTDYIPQISDTLSSAARQPMSSMFQGGMRQWNESSGAKLIGGILATPQSTIGGYYQGYVEKAQGAVDKKMGKGEEYLSDKFGMKGKVVSMLFLSGAKQGVGMVGSVLRAPATVPSMYKAANQMLDVLEHSSEISSAVFSMDKPSTGLYQDLLGEKYTKYLKDKKGSV